MQFVNSDGYRRRELWDDEGWEWIQSQGVSHPAFWLPQTAATDTATDAWQWRGMFAAAPLRADAAVYVSHAEASAYARWKGRRLMTEAEFHRAAEGATAGHVDFAGFDPVAVGSYPESASIHGVHDLIGNGWE